MGTEHETDANYAKLVLVLKIFYNLRCFFFNKIVAEITPDIIKHNGKDQMLT